VTDDSLDWFTDIEWGPCPGWCVRNPDPAVNLGDGGHFTDLREDGAAIWIHDCRWPLPDSDGPEAVHAVELEAIETCTKAGKPQLGEVRFLVNSDKRQYMSLAAAAAASGIIRQALAEMAVR
jgi:hypothetical protein